jgi:hypothetical protein
VIPDTTAATSDEVYAAEWEGTMLQAIEEGGDARKLAPAKIWSVK